MSQAASPTAHRLPPLRRPPRELSQLEEDAAKALRLIRRGILTHRSLPDPDRRYQSGPKNSLAGVLVRLKDEGDYPEERRLRSFEPTAQDQANWLTVYGWLTWLKHEVDGKRDVEILVSRAFGKPIYKIAEKFGRSDDTIRRYEAAAVATIAHYFRGQIRAMVE